MGYERIPLESTDAPQPEQVARFLEILDDPAAQPVYVHCLHGVDRTGTMIALYRMRMQHWTNSDALAEMEHFGAHSVLHDPGASSAAIRRASERVPRSPVAVCHQCAALATTCCVSGSGPPLAGGNVRK